MRVLIVSVFLVLANGSSVAAQSGMLFGGNSFAQECYRDSRTAVRFDSASWRDLDSCDRAINEGTLKKRDRAATYVNRGIIYMHIGKPDLAQKDYEKAIALQEDTGEAYLNRGNIAFISNRLADAESDYNKALDMGVSEMHVAHLNRGMVREMQKDLLGARSDYESALGLRENWSQALMRLNRVSKKIESSDTSQ